MAIKDNISARKVYFIPENMLDSHYDVGDILYGIITPEGEENCDMQLLEVVRVPRGWLAAAIPNIP